MKKKTFINYEEQKVQLNQQIKLYQGKDTIHPSYPKDGRIRGMNNCTPHAPCWRTGRRRRRPPDRGAAESCPAPSPPSSPSCSARDTAYRPGPASDTPGSH